MFSLWKISKLPFYKILNQPCERARLPTFYLKNEPRFQNCERDVQQTLWKGIAILRMWFETAELNAARTKRYKAAPLALLSYEQALQPTLCTTLICWFMLENSFPQRSQIVLSLRWIIRVCSFRWLRRDVL